MFVFSSEQVKAQDLSKYYVSYSQPAGMLYYILPQANFRNPETKSYFIMDITYLDYKDFVTVNFTYTDKESIDLETISVSYNDWLYQTTLKQIYVDIVKSRWEYRYTFDMPLNQFFIFFMAKDPIITITADSHRIILLHTVKRWKKNAEINNRIIQIIQKNKRIQNL
jgi:hypothetical protein